MTDNTKPTDDSGKHPLIGVPPQEFINLFQYLATGNLAALLRLTAVCQYLDEYAKTLPEDDKSRAEIRKCLSGLGLAGQCLCKQARELSDHEDALSQSCEKQGVTIEPKQTDEWARNITNNVTEAAQEWLKHESIVKEKPLPEDKPERKPDSRRGGSDFGPNGQRLN